MPKFSIIVPVYNAEYYLPRCIDSLIGQSFHNIEIILINDGSTDSSKQICEEYAQKNNRISIINTENCGVSTARNIGLKKATGNYIMFADSDDYIDTKACETFNNILEKNPTLEIISGHHKSHFHNKIKENKHTLCSGIINGKDYLKTQIKAKTMSFGVWEYVYQKHFLEKHNLILPEKLKLYEDIHFISRVFLQAHEVYVSDYFHYNYFNHPVSLSKRTGIENIEPYLIMFNDLVAIFNSIEDNELKKILLDNLTSLSFQTFYQKKLYRKPYWTIFKSVFHYKYAHTFLCKTAVVLVKINPVLAYYLYKIYSSIRY